MKSTLTKIEPVRDQQKEKYTMIIIAHHQVKDPKTFWAKGKKAWTRLPDGLRLLKLEASGDGSHAVSLWNASSLEEVQGHVESTLGQLNLTEFHDATGITSLGLSPRGSTHPDDFPLPAAVAFPAGVFNPAIVLLRVNETSVQAKYFNVGPWAHGWGRWDTIPVAAPPVANIEDTGSYFPLLGWRGEDLVSHWKGFFSIQSSPRFGNPVGRVVGIPFEDLITNEWSALDVPATAAASGFEPRTGFTWRHGNTPRLNIFGIANPPNRSPAQVNYLRELWWDGNEMRFTDHGLPPDANEVKIGGHSAIWPAGDNNQSAWVFVVAGENDFPGQDRLWARYWHAQDQSAWDWRYPNARLGLALGYPFSVSVSGDLGYPENVRAMREPLAFSYLDAQTEQPHINVFVVGFDRDQNTWQLYNRYWHDGDWGDWRAWGSPPGAGTGCGSGFHLTSGVVWYDGPTLRINLFGYTDAELPGGARHSGDRLGVEGHLITFWWDGAGWHWDETVPVPSNRPFRTISSVVFADNGRTRISVFGRDNLGTIFERYWDTAEALQWRFLQH